MIRAPRFAVEQPEKRKSAHKHYCAPYMSECLRCRNERRWQEYTDGGGMIFTKRHGYVARARKARR